MAEVKQPDPQLIAEAKERMENEGAAKSLISDNHAWFKKHWDEIGNLEHAGLWMGGRQKFKEVLMPTIFIEALYLVMEQDDMPAAILVEMLEQKQMRDLLHHTEWGERIKARLGYLNADKGLKLEWGKPNYTPVNKRPSENNYAILEPGDAIKVTEPDPEPAPEPADPEDRIVGAE